MQYKEIHSAGLNKVFEVSVPGTEVDNKIKSKLFDIGKTLKLPGFRPGKVPAQIVEKKYKDSVKSEVVQNLINETVTKIVSEFKIDLFQSPAIKDFKLEEDNNLNFTVNMESNPKIDFPNMKDITIERLEPEVKEDDINVRLNQLIKDHKKFEDSTVANYKTKLGDAVVIDFEGFVEDKTFEGGAAKDFQLELGSKSFIDTFEEQLVSKKTGEDLEVSVTFPENYHSKNLAGKDAVFKVRINKILKHKKFKLDDEFAKEFECENIEALNEKIKNQIEMEFRNESNLMLKMDLFDKFQNMLKFDVPESVVESEYKQLNKQLDEEAKQDDHHHEHSESCNHGETCSNEHKKELVTKKDKNTKAVDEYKKNLVLRRVRIGFMLSQYAKDKNIHVTQEDLNRALVAEISHLPEHIANMWVNYYKNNKVALQGLVKNAIEQKVVDNIINNEINVVVKQCSISEFKKMIKQKESELQKTFS